MTNQNHDQKHKYHHLTKTLNLTLKMTATQVVEISVTTNSLSEDYSHLDDHTKQTTDTPGFKPFTNPMFVFVSYRCADYLKHILKKLLIILFAGTALAQLVFSLTCAQLIPSSTELLYSSIIIGGLLGSDFTPLLFELVMECVCPVGEGVSVGVLLFFGNGVYLAFAIVFMFPGVDVRWMNWTTVGSLGLCVLGLCLYQERYRRLDTDIRDAESRDLVETSQPDYNT